MWDVPRPNQAEILSSCFSGCPLCYDRRQSDLNLMLSRGWCKHQVYSLARTCRSDVFHHLASLDQHPSRKIDHALCDSTSNCIAHNVDMRNYKSRHVDAACTCVSVAVSDEQLLAINDQHEVPLVSIESQSDLRNDRPILNLQKRSTGSKYIAISHIWFDGLGNPEANALPSCQLRRLAERLRNVTGSSNVCSLATHWKTSYHANLSTVFVLARHFVYTHLSREDETKQHCHDGIDLCWCHQCTCPRR